MKHQLELMIDFVEESVVSLVLDLSEIIEGLRFHAVCARTQPLINQSHTQQRLLFSQHNSDEDWSQIILSDEKVLEVDVSKIVHWIP